MIQQLLLRRLDKLGARYRFLRLWQMLSLVWLLAAIAGGFLWAWKIQTTAAATMPAILLGTAALLLAMVAVWLAAHSARSYSWLAQQVEAAFPELRTCLLAAVEQRPDLPSGEFGYLQSSVIREALEHSKHHPWADVVPLRKLIVAALTNVLAFCLFGSVLTGAVVTAFAAAENLPSASLIPAAPKGPEVIMTVEPGDAEVELGSSLLVLARIEGPMPTQGMLAYQVEGGEEVSIAMPPSLEDPVLSGRIAVVDHPLEYQVHLESQSSPKYRVTVFEYPRLERADVQLVYPSYTGLAERTIQDVRTVSVVEGTRLTLRCTLNKPVASATLVNTRQDDQAPSIVLSQSKTDPLVYEMTLECQQSRRLKLELLDDRNRSQKKIEQFAIHVVPNQPPRVKPVFPAKDIEVSALQELDLKANISDDFGVERMGLSYSLAGQSPIEVVLGEKISAKGAKEIAHQVKLEELKAEPDQLLSYFWWVEDFDAAGKLRRTDGDMYFAEVRPFDQIFRQGDQPPGGAQQQQQGQGGAAQEAQKLAKLQKDIINATWKIFRRESSDKLTPAFADDVEQVRQSQATAIEQTVELAEKLQDEQSQGHIEEVLQQMQTAVENLEKAIKVPSRDPLTPALAAEQAAYQALLRLRAREHEVVRQQQQQSGQGQQSGAQSQQQREQLDQLDLKEEENRYETQRDAEEQKQESAQERENRQVLNRLRELAQRQHDLNERLKELQAALEEAKGKPEEEEIRRQLQRLQDEQRQILQDTDELQSRLDQPENQERMSEERQQLDETRDQVRRASEALQQEKVGQAAAAGARAEQKFDELREEFRRRASNRFQQEMKQMRETARELEKKQGDLSEQLKTQAEPKEQKPSLSLQDEPDDSRQKISEQIGEQRKRLDNLQEQMRDTIERAEATEPILSERLYETARNLRDHSIDQALEMTERMVRQGLSGEAQRQEAAAGEAVERLREGIERAAEGVLGDETEALRRAREELKELSRELNDELARNAPDKTPQGSLKPSAGDQPGQPKGNEPKGNAEQPQAGDSKPSQQKPGESGQPDQQADQNGQQQKPGDGPNRGEEQKSGQGKQPGQSQESGQGKQSDQGESNSGGKKPGEGQQPGEGQKPGEGQEPSQGQTSQEGKPQPGEAPTDGNQPGQGETGQSGQAQQPGQNDEPGQRNQTSQANGQRNRTTAGGTPAGPGVGPFDDYIPGVAAPLTGEGFRPWSDRLRDVEEMVDDPDLRSEAARIRERARAMRVELKRHPTPPNWDLVRDQLVDPLNELQQRVAEELLRRTSKKALVPLDRDPVPPQYSEKTRRYYERLGSGK